MAKRLWVVGEKDPDPETWSIWSEYSLVIADTEEEAVKLAGNSPGTAVAEIDMTRVQCLVSMPEPNWGDDT